MMRLYSLFDYLFLLGLYYKWICLSLLYIRILVFKIHSFPLSMFHFYSVFHHLYLFILYKYFNFFISIVYCICIQSLFIFFISYDAFVFYI